MYSEQSNKEIIFYRDRIMFVNRLLHSMIMICILFSIIVTFGLNIYHDPKSRNNFFFVIFICIFLPLITFAFIFTSYKLRISLLDGLAIRLEPESVA